MFVCLSKVFEIMEEAKVRFNLEDYSVKQVTLEQIFLTLANTDKMILQPSPTSDPLFSHC